MKINLCLDIEINVPGGGFDQDDIDAVVKKVEEKVLAIDEVSSTDVMDVLY